MNTFRRLLLIGALFYGLALSVAAAAPVLTEVAPVPLLSTDTTPQVTINSTELVDLVYGGACGVDTELTMGPGNIVHQFPVLADGTYSNCSVVGTNPITFLVSNTLTLSAFTIDTTPPVFTSIDLQNEASDGVITAAESTSGLPAVGNLVATGYSSVEYLVAANTATCSLLGGYTSGAFSVNEITTDGTWKVCVKLSDTVGNVAFGASANITRDTVAPVFTSLDLTNEASDGVITAAESKSGLPAVGNLVASGHTSTDYVLAASTATCSALGGYGAAIPAVSDVLPDGTWKVCVRLRDAVGNTTFGASGNITRDTGVPVFTSLDLINGASDGFVNIGEAVSGLPLAGNLIASGQDFTNYVIAASTATCSLLGGYAASVPAISDISADGTWKVCVKISDTAGNVAFGASGNVQRDTVAPVFTSLDLTNEASDGVITFAESTSGLPLVGNLVASGQTSTDYVLAASTATCSALGGYAAAVPVVSDLSTDGTWKTCVRLSDAAGNITFNESASVRRDTAIPAFSSLSVLSNNPFDASYGRQGSTLTFTLQLTAADSYAGGGSIDLMIGATPITLSFVEGASTAEIVNYTATHTITTENGTITITNVTFADAYGQALTGFVAGAPTPTVTIDSTAPTMNALSVATTGNAGWARAGQVVTYTMGFSEDILGSPVTPTTAFNTAAVAQKDFNYPAFVTSGTLEFNVVAGNNGLITINNGNISLQDRAGNTTLLTAAMINALAIGLEITADTTVPTIAGVSIISNNALDTSLAKTNDTITVSLTTADNLSPSVTLLAASHILNKTVTDGVTGAVGAGTIARFTDGTETSQVIVPFGVGVTDEAGNTSAWVTATSDGSMVRFDRTNPVIQNVRLSAVSQDGSAYLGDVPDYYAKQGDDITLRFEARDWVDLLNGGINGTLFALPVSLAKTNPACDGTVTWCEWSTTITNVDGIEGFVTFDILALDNAGNGDGTTNPEVHVTGTTDGSSVIFDKTIPVNPTDVVDLQGASTTSFKAGTSAIYTWGNDSDPLPASGANAGVWKYYVAFTNPDNGGEVHSGSLVTLSQETVSLYDNAGNLVGSRYYDATISDLAPWTGRLIPPRNITPVYYPYQLRMITVDKAGNMPYNTFGDITQLAATEPQVVYEQPYTISIYGTVTDRLGNPVKNALVQVAARYGEFCDDGKEVCTDMTDALGRYSILVNKDQDYNITFFAQGAYTNKKDRSILADYFLLDVSLSDQENIHEEQIYESIVYLTLTKTVLIGENLEHMQFEIYTNSGQITTRQENETVVINSLSTITKVRQIIPFVGGFITPADTPATLTSDLGTTTITRSGNEWRITGGGSVFHHNGTETDYDTDQYYNGYGDRLAIILDPRNGEHGYSGDVRDGRVLDGHIWTKEEVQRDLERVDAGNDPAVLYYTNVNGYAIFAGYRSGTLPMEKCGERYRNRVRLGTNATVGETDLAEKLQEMKALAGSEKEVEEVSKRSQLAPLVRERSGNEAKSALARQKYNDAKVDKFARYNPNSNPVDTKLSSRNYSNIRMTVGGKSVSMDKVVGRATGGY